MRETDEKEPTQFWPENVKERDCHLNVIVNGGIILKRTLNRMRQSGLHAHFKGCASFREDRVAVCGKS